MDRITEELLHRLESWCEAYPPEIFTPLEGSPMKKTGDYDTSEKRTLITRASAQMGRHMIERALKPAVDEIRRLSAHVHSFSGHPVATCECGAKLVPSDWQVIQS